MPTFTYQAKQGPTQVVHGTIEATSQEEVVARLLQDGLVPVTILIRADTLEEPSTSAPRLRIRGKERRLFVRQLASLLRAKMELVPAVTILAEQSASRPMRALLTDVERHMREGNPFSDALARHPRVFAPYLLSAVRAGEASGTLDGILLKLVELDEQQEELESRFKGALAYPLLLLAVGSACLVLFIRFVVPRMAGLFDQLGGALPWPTQTLVNLSAWLSQYWGLCLAIAAVGIPLMRALARRPAVSAMTERVLMHVVFARELLEARRIGRFTRTLQMLLNSGLPIFQAMEVARPTMQSRAIEQRMRQAQEHVKQGDSIADSLQAARCFPPLVTRMIAVGEAGGTLVDVLGEIATYYERALSEQLRLAATLLEPLIILVVGALVGFCVLAMVLPIFQMTQLVR